MTTEYSNTSYYQITDDLEWADVLNWSKLPYSECEAITHIVRHRHKAGREDLNKALSHILKARHLAYDMADNKEQLAEQTIKFVKNFYGV